MKQIIKSALVILIAIGFGAGMTAGAILVEWN